MKPLFLTEAEYDALANVYPSPPCNTGRIMQHSPGKTRHAIACRDADGNAPPPAARCAETNLKTLEAEFVLHSVKGRLAWRCKAPYRPGDVCYLSTPLDVLSVDGDEIRCYDVVGDHVVTRRAPKHVAMARELLAASKGMRTRWIGVIPPQFAAMDRVVIDGVDAPRLVSGLSADDLEDHGAGVDENRLAMADKPTRRRLLEESFLTHHFLARERDLQVRDAWIWPLLIRRTFAEHVQEAAS